MCLLSDDVRTSKFLFLWQMLQNYDFISNVFCSCTGQFGIELVERMLELRYKA